MLNKLRDLYFRSKVVRDASNLVYWLLNPRQRQNTGHLLMMPEEKAFGPVQREEALFLFGIIRVIRPKIIVEFGFFGGRSAMNFLQALPNDSEIHSFDISESSAFCANERFSNEGRFHFHKKSQADFKPEDIDNRKIDFAFIDASHVLELNQKTFEAILPCLSEKAILAIHDTGNWAKEYLSAFRERGLTEPEHGKWLNEDLFEYKDQLDERKFVNWIGENYPDWQIIHFHSENCLRHGITLLQRSKFLPVSA